MGWFCHNRNFSFWGENAVKPGDSGYKPGNSGFWDTPGETPGIGPETPDFRNPDTPGMSPEIPGFNRTVGCRIG